MDLLFIRASGIVALTITMLGLVAPKDRHMLRFLTVGALIWALNNYLIGAHTACALSLLSSVRTWTSLKVSSRPLAVRGSLCISFCAAAVVAARLTWMGAISLLPMSGALLSTSGNFLLKGVRLRMALGLSNALWLTSAIHFRAWEQVISLCATLLATCFGVWRAYQGSASPNGELQPQ
jgi:hypothetical protein